MTQPKPKRPVLQLVLLGVLLIVFPLGSFLYLRAGYAYQVASWDEIDPRGAIEDVLPYPRPDSTLDVVYFASPGASDSIATAIRSVQAAFADNPHVRFVGMGAAAETFLPAGPQSLVVPTPSRSAEAVAASLAERLPDCAQVDPARRGYLIDRTGQLRRCYDLHDGASVRRLVEQLALIIPRPKGEDVVLERRTEL